MPETSIVIRSFNEADYIESVLEAIQTQEYQNFEIILVDSGSTDGTLEIAEAYVDRIEFVTPANFTFGYSCNVGCESAEGEFIVFLSAHAIPTDNYWLGTMIENLYDDEVAMTYSNQVGAETTKFPEQRLFNELFPEESRRQSPPDYWANNASSAIRKELWEEHRFHEYLTGHEDIEWAKHFMDQGYAVIYESEASVYHIHDETWNQVFNRFEREAIADVEIGIKSPSDRWQELLAIPTDIVGDVVAAFRQGVLSIQVLGEIVRFRYNQHMGTASGLQSERDLESDRYEYFYREANEQVVIRGDGTTGLERSPLPKLRPSEVLIRTDYVGVTTEFENREISDNEHIIPSGNYVGTVADIGANANTVEVGDTVVGSTTFGCGLCQHCSDGNDQACEDPVKLGIDTETGAYAKFIPVPSDHVYPLPENATPKQGTLVRTLAKVSTELDKAGALVSYGSSGLVIGDTPIGQIATQIFDHEHDYDIDHTANGEYLDDLSAYKLIVDTTGDPLTVERYLQYSRVGTVVLLLGTGYGDITLPDGSLNGITIINPGRSSFDELDRGIELLSIVETESILDGTYSLEAYETAWQAAAEREQMPVIEIDT